MKIRKGVNRTVIIFPRLKLAFKFPAFFRILNLPIKKIAIRILKSTINENYKEYKFYQKTKFSFLQPTYFSLFGLVNIQLAGKSIHADHNYVYYQAMYILLNNLDLQTYMKIVGKFNTHNFANRNFCDADDNVRLVDYSNGSCDKNFQTNLMIYGPLIFENFDVTWIYYDELKHSKLLKKKWLEYKKSTTKKTHSNE
jgi:hypothetical protein